MGALFVGDGALDVPLTHQVFKQTYRTVAPPSCFYVQINFAKTFYGYCISERNIV